MSAPRIRTPRRRPIRAEAPSVRRKRERWNWLPRIPRNVRLPWRVVSAVLVVSMLMVGVFLFASPIFYVSTIEIGGLRHVPPEEVFGRTGIATYHILWINSEEVKSSVESLPSIERAEVRVFWPARVVVEVREREPALIWEQDGRRFWVDVNGNLMLQRADLPDLVRIVNQGDAIPYRCPGIGCPEGVDSVRINEDVVLGAIQMKTLRADIGVLYYNPEQGLSFQDPRGWRGDFGVGIDMNIKLALYEALVADLSARGLKPAYIDVSDPTSPYYRLTP